MRLLRTAVALTIGVAGVLAVEYAFFFVGVTGECGAIYRPGLSRYGTDNSGSLPACPPEILEQFAIGGAGLLALLVIAPLVFGASRDLGPFLARTAAMGAVNVGLMGMAMAAGMIAGGATPGGSGIGGGLIAAATVLVAIVSLGSALVVTYFVLRKTILSG